MHAASTDFPLRRSSIFLVILAVAAFPALTAASISACNVVPTSPCSANFTWSDNFTAADRVLLDLIASDIAALQSLPASVFTMYPDLAVDPDFWQEYNPLSFANTTVNGAWSLHQAALVMAVLFDNITSIFQEGLADPSQQTTLNAQWMNAVASANATSAALKSEFFSALRWLGNYTDAVTDLYASSSAVIANCSMTNSALTSLANANATLSKQLAACGANTTCVNETRSLLALNAAWAASNASVLAVCTPLLPLMNNISAASQGGNQVLRQLISLSLLPATTFNLAASNVVFFTPISWTTSPFLVKVEATSATQRLMGVACSCQLDAMSLCQAFSSD